MGHMNVVLFLLQHGANPNSTTVRGETSLHLAARANQTDILRILLRNGAQVDAKARVSSVCAVSSFFISVCTGTIWCPFENEIITIC